MTGAVIQGGGWEQLHTHMQEEGESDPGVLGQLIYSLHPFLILMFPLCKLYKPLSARPSSSRNH